MWACAQWFLCSHFVRACVCGRKREIAACFACKGENTCAQSLSSRRLLCFTPPFAVVLVTLLSVLRVRWNWCNLFSCFLEGVRVFFARIVFPTYYAFNSAARKRGGNKTWFAQDVWVCVCGTVLVCWCVYVSVCGYRAGLLCVCGCFIFNFWGKIGDRLRMLFKINSSSDFILLCECV